jgi:hypothetical protein
MYVVVSKLPDETELYVEQLNPNASKNPDKFARLVANIYQREIDPKSRPCCPDIRVEFRRTRREVLWFTHKYAHYYWFKH